MHLDSGGKSQINIGHSALVISCDLFSITSNETCNLCWTRTPYIRFCQIPKLIISSYSFILTFVVLPEPTLCSYFLVELALTPCVLVSTNSSSLAISQTLAHKPNNRGQNHLPIVGINPIPLISLVVN